MLRPAIFQTLKFVDQEQIQTQSGVIMTALVVAISRPFSDYPDLKEIVLLSAAGLLVSILLMLYGPAVGPDMGLTF